MFAKSIARRQTIYWVLLLSLIGLSLADARVWTDLDGRTLEAEFIERTDAHIKVRRLSDQRDFTIPINRLSDVDQNYLRNHLKKSPKMNFPENGLDWADKIEVPDDFEVQVIHEDNATDTFVYRSNHFTFTSNVKLARKVVREFAEIFEATLILVQQSPLQWDIETPKNGFQAEFYEDETSYRAAGGPDGTAGVYLSGKRVMLVRLDKLSTKKTSSSLSLDEGAQGTLVHEITHQVQHDCLKYLPTWLVEGYAEYTEVIPFERGKFRIDRIELEKESASVTLMEPPLELLKMSRSEWNGRFDLDPYGVTRQYQSAYLLTYFFMHLDGDEDGKRLWQYIRALEAGKSDALSLLLDGRDDTTLREDIIDAYDDEGIEIEFY